MITYLSKFSWQQNVLLVVWSQYLYFLVISKIFQQNKVPTKIYILSCARILFKISLIY
jgi:hypothetical protein